MQADFDFAVIGAGIVGASVAWRLTAGGHRILLLDGSLPGSGASYGNAGMIAAAEFLPMATFATLRSLPRIAMHADGAMKIVPRYLPRLLPWGLRFLAASRPSCFQETVRAMAPLCLAASMDTKALLAEIGAAEMLVRNDFLRLFPDEAAFDAVSGAWERRRSEGLDFTRHDRQAIESLVPDLASGHAVGVSVRNYHHLSDPQAVVRRLVSAAEARGARFHRSPVTGFRTEDRAVQVTTADGAEFSAGKIVIAAGAWSNRLAAMVGDRFPLETQRGYHLQFSNPGIALDRTLAFSDLGIAVLPMAEHIRVTSYVEFAGLHHPPVERRFEVIARKARKVFPKLDPASATRWMGHRPALPDDRPVVGQSHRNRSVYYCFGHGHVGVTLAAGTSRLLAGMIEGTVPDGPENPFRPDRF
ncbi:FAD-binding oxidoreductase [Ruegeria pomeroyi]|nr:FAD-binding oxidoreductase [Ruegeria pomeroyi]